MTQHVSGTIVPIFRSASLHPGFPGLQPARQMLKTICSYIQACALEDGHSGARNMLNHWFINKS